MRIRIHDIEEATKELAFDEPTAEFNPLLVQGPVHDFQFASPAGVEMRYYRAGQELFFSGTMRAAMVGECARCLEPYRFTLTTTFSFVLIPHSHDEEEIEDPDLAYYRGDEVDLSPLLRDRMLVALPTLPLCSETCKGLCPHCGTNLNTGECGCSSSEGEPRFAILRSFKVSR